MNKSLIAETQSLMATLSLIQKGGVEALGIDLPTRTSIKSA